MLITFPVFTSPVSTKKIMVNYAENVCYLNEICTYLTNRTHRQDF